MNFLTLNTELALPAYTALSDQAAADLLNDVVVTRIKASMSGSEFFANTDETQYAGLTDAQKQQWISFCGIESHDPVNNGVAHKFVQNIFGAGATLSALSAARQETISRAIELGLSFITAPYVAHARTL